MGVPALGVRGLLLASVSAGLLADGGWAYAQDKDSGSYTTELPPVEVTAPKSGTKPSSRPKTAARVVRPAVTRLRVYPTTPLASPGTALSVDKVASSLNFVDTNDIARTNSLNIGDALVQSVPAININEVTGNPFQPNVEFRGFVGSPVSGTPQGLAVYQNGVRINEAFGDTVNWDLIPTAAIKSVAVVTNNPAYGLNALGGAVSVQMKDGFSYQGAEINTMGGSYNRLQSSAQWGKQVDNFAVYGALEGVHDDGFRNFSPSDIRRFYSDVGYRTPDSEFHLNLGVADNKFGATVAVPVELLQQYWGATYTTPQTSNNQVAYANFSGRADVTPSWTVETVAHVRAFGQQTVDGNPTNTQPCAADATLLCFGDADPVTGLQNPANGLNGAQLANTFPDGSILTELDRTSTRSVTGGFSVQATNTDELFGHGNRFVVGTSLDSSVTRFIANSELGTMASNYFITGSGIALGRSGSPVSIGPVALRTTNQYTGFYALDTFDVTKEFSLTAGGRYNDARITLDDQTGMSPLLNSTSNYDRFNPIIGGTYKITSELTAYAGYSEANRAPTPLELGCADPANPCIIQTFLVSDPALKQVVSHTVEAGFRGTREMNIGTLEWKLGGFRATNTNDILAIPDNVIQGFGFFQNVGDTRRQGIEAEAKLKSSAFEVYGSYTFIDARFLDALQLDSNSPAAVANGGTIQVVPGDQIPAIPRHRIKAGFDYFVTDAFKVGADAIYVSSQYFVGDESNQEPKLPGYAVVNVHASYQINKTVQIYGKINNLLDNHYATYGTFFDTAQLPNFANNGAPFTNAQTVSPAYPRTFYAGMKVTF